MCCACCSVEMGLPMSTYVCIGAFMCVVLEPMSQGTCHVNARHQIPTCLPCHTVYMLELENHNHFTLHEAVVRAGCPRIPQCNPLCHAHRLAIAFVNIFLHRQLSYQQPSSMALIRSRRKGVHQGAPAVAILVRAKDRVARELLDLSALPMASAPSAPQAVPLRSRTCAAQLADYLQVKQRVLSTGRCCNALEGHSCHAVGAPW
jgi:hypothetical protein